MTRIALFLGCALACIACTSQEDQLENAMRAELSKNGEVKQVEMTKQGEDRMTGFATVVHNGVEGRRICSAQRDPAKSGSYYNWRCVPAVDEAMINEVEGAIRQSLAQRATVDQVEMSRQDDDHMTGFATVSDGSGNQARADCTAWRAADGSFSWRCRDAAEAAAPAGPGAAEPTPAEEAGGK